MVRTTYLTQKTNLKNKASENTASKRTTPPSRLRGSGQTGFRMQLPKGLGALLPGLSSTYCCIFDGGVRTDVTASIALKGTQKETEKAKQKRKEGLTRGQKRMQGENRLTTNQHTGSGSTAVSAGTAPSTGVGQTIRKEKKNKTQDDRSSLK